MIGRNGFAGKDRVETEGDARRRRIILGVAAILTLMVVGWYAWEFYKIQTPKIGATFKAVRPTVAVASAQVSPEPRFREQAKGSSDDLFVGPPAPAVESAVEPAKVAGAPSRKTEGKVSGPGYEIEWSKKHGPKTAATSPPKKPQTAVKVKEDASPREEVWRHWGAAPYASSKEEACRKAPQAIDGFDIPAFVKGEFKRQVGSACSSKEVWLVPHQPLEEMWSGGAKPHVMKKVTVAELPVAKSPDGRSYRKGAVAQTAKAQSWLFVHEGKAYVLYLPDVCFNWAWSIVDLPTTTEVARENCVEVTFNVPTGGKVRWGVGTITGPLLPNACNAVRQGNGPWLSWYGECELCIPAIGYIAASFGGKAEVPHKYYYPTTASRQTLRFPRAIWSALVYLCLEDADAVQTCGVYIRPQDWNGRVHIVLPDSLWRWDGNCPE